MDNLIIPQDYKSALNLHDTQIGIKTVKDFFQVQLAERLHLLRVSAPLFVEPASGLNDNLNGVERPVTFGIKEQDDAPAEIVHSLAKWKRMALGKYGFSHGEGLPAAHPPPEAASSPLQSVQRQAEGLREVLQKPGDLLHLHPPQGLQGLPSGVAELVVAGFDLL